ncbi:MAG: glycosyltransferase family 61 protein [Gloeomargarita sp. SKYBB_i_bin120]|nr:glycosyltransferase family 61 protein [Gloeomargarita sp. SKYG98]MCS7291887.1 glycosyltransferase family 61 protein [Gloeomargarita sp. SKYB120]MDW8177447.1 glycosyltransferase family 61 protein [Gloeomargarita sp. SKYBB_i_bin120]
MGSVIAHDGRVIHDSSRQCSFPVAHNEALHRRFPPVQWVDHTIAVMTDGSGGANYWHWLINIVPKFILLQQGDVWPKIDYFLVDQPLKQLEITLEILGVPQAKRIPTKFNYSLRSPLVVVPTFIREIPPWILDGLRTSFLPYGQAPLQPHPKVYISRRKAQRRRILNEAQVVDYLVSRGYTVCCLEDLSFLEQVGLFRGARYVIGVHGAGLTNLVWGESGGRVLEIFPAVPCRDCYWILAHQAGWDYYYWYPDSQHGNENYDADLWIDMAMFPQVVEHFES